MPRSKKPKPVSGTLAHQQLKGHISLSVAEIFAAWSAHNQLRLWYRRNAKILQRLDAAVNAGTTRGKRGRSLGIARDATALEAAMLLDAWLEYWADDAAACYPRFSIIASQAHDAATSSDRNTPAA